MSMRTRAGKKISLTNYEELLAVPTIEGASDIPLDQLHEFKGHPFHVVDDEAMDMLKEMGYEIKALSKGLSVNLQDRYLNMGELIDGLTVAPVANIPVTVYPDQITDYTRQILEHNTGEEVIMNYFDQESRQSGRHRIILLIILVFLVGISVSMVYYIRHNSYNGSSRQQTEQPYTSDIYTEAVSKDVSTQDKSIRNEEAHITTEAATETVTTQVPPTQIQSTTTESSTKKEYQIKESSDYDEFQLGD